MKLILIVLLVIVVTVEVLSNPVDDGVRTRSRNVGGTQKPRDSTDTAQTDSDSTEAPYETREVPSQENGKQNLQKVTHELHIVNAKIKKCCKEKPDDEFIARIVEKNHSNESHSEIFPDGQLKQMVDGRVNQNLHLNSGDLPEDGLPKINIPREKRQFEEYDSIFKTVRVIDNVDSLNTNTPILKKRHIGYTKDNDTLPDSKTMRKKRQVALNLATLEANKEKSYNEIATPIDSVALATSGVSRKRQAMSVQKPVLRNSDAIEGPAILEEVGRFNEKEKNAKTENVKNAVKRQTEDVVLDHLPRNIESLDKSTDRSKRQNLPTSGTDVGTMTMKTEESADRTKRFDEASIPTLNQFKDYLEKNEASVLKTNASGVLNKRQVEALGGSEDNSTRFQRQAEDTRAPDAPEIGTIHTYNAEKRNKREIKNTEKSETPQNASKAQLHRAVRQELTLPAASTSIPDPQYLHTIREGQHQNRAANIAADGNVVQDLNTPKKHCNHHDKFGVPQQMPVDVIRVAPANIIHDANVSGALSKESVVIEQIREDSGRPALQEETIPGSISVNVRPLTLQSVRIGQGKASGSDTNLDAVKQISVDKKHCNHDKSGDAQAKRQIIDRMYPSASDVEYMKREEMYIQQYVPKLTEQINTHIANAPRSQTADGPKEVVTAQALSRGIEPSREGGKIEINREADHPAVLNRDVHRPSRESPLSRAEVEIIVDGALLRILRMSKQYMNHMDNKVMMILLLVISLILITLSLLVFLRIKVKVPMILRATPMHQIY